MRFGFDVEERAMRDAVRAFCAGHLDLGDSADMASREGKPTDPAYWLALADLGVLETLADEPGTRTGIGPAVSPGTGPKIGIVAASIAFEQLGAHLVTGPVLWSTLAAPYVEGVAAGEVRVAGVELEDRTDGPVVVEHVEDCDALLVLRSDRVEVCSRSDLPPAVDGSPLDPLTPVAVVPSIPPGRVVGGADAARRLRRSGEILSAALLVGIAQGALDVARGYALEREQFGVPIGSFQAIKHLLADMYVRVELARAATYAAAAVAADPRAGDVRHCAASAKLLAGEAGIANGRASVQILGGMGFTWDMLPHYFLKRAWVLEHGFGTARAHAARLAASLGTEVASP
jgi:alkylation response protein AidB-like acyl-CoA dehydrogenase